jgi:membrane-associated phospholipid phosphatase
VSAAERTAVARWRRLLDLDRDVLVRVRTWEAPWLTPLMRAFTRAGDAFTHTVVAAAFILAGGTARVAGVRIAIAAGFAAGLVQALKRTCRRPRPDVGIGGFTALAENPDCFSFPSGHSAAAAAVAVALAGAGGLLGPVALGLGVAIAASRVYLGAHYPLDVAAGVLLGGIAGAICRLLLG